MMHWKKIDDAGRMFKKRLNSALGIKSSIKVCVSKKLLMPLKENWLLRMTQMVKKVRCFNI